MNVTMKKKYLLLSLFCVVFTASAQYFDESIKPTNLNDIQNALNENMKSNYLESDLDSWIIQSDASSRNKNAWYYYLVQTHNNIVVRNTITTILKVDGVVSIANTRFVKGLESKITVQAPTLLPKDAVIKSLEFHKLTNVTPKLLDFDKDKGVYVFEKTQDLQSDIKVNLIYELISENKIELTWNVNLDFKDGSHWWNTRINAVTGEFVSQNDWVLSCNWDSDKPHNHKYIPEQDTAVDFSSEIFKNNTETFLMAGSYRVLPYYSESPNHGNFELISNPDDPTASPSGWHNDGSAYTTTRGNNVIARDDQNGNNGNGPLTNQSNTGLVFDYTYGGPSVAASSYIDAAATQLFYMSNVVHDVYYRYGFDEASGNFQQNNFANGGSNGDPVDADVQDGSGVNNANFSTPTDGNNGRMQMFLWNQGAYDANAQPLLTINNTYLAGDYLAVDNNFTAGDVPVTSPITSNLVLIDDGTPDTSDGCEAAVNAAALNGNIAVVRRGACNFTAKTINAQNAGAVAILIVNNVSPGDPPLGGGDAAITIPTYGLNQSDGEAIISEIALGTVNGTFNVPSVPPAFVNIDGDFDNGVVGHEYGHGINIRLVGGRFNSGCVNATESMGEGWGDFIGKILLLKDIDNGIALSGTGTFVVGQAPDGQGIRPAPYSGDISNNPMTYETLRADTGNATYTVPHGVGSVWAGILWDMTWDLIAVHGFTEDIYDSNGMFGNTIALNLVVEAMKLTACDPGFVDGRDAILQADNNLYGGANQCVIWSAFARRGVGLSANQGNTNSTSDGAHAYDLPVFCTPNFLIDNGDSGLKEVCQGTTTVVYDFVFYEQNAYDTDTPFTASGLPSGAIATFSPATMKDTGLFSLSVSGIPAGVSGNFPITVTPNGDTSKNKSVNLIINPTNPDLTDGDTEYSIDSGSFISFANGGNVELLPGSDLDLQLPASAFNGTLIWTGPDSATYTNNTISFSSVVDNDPSIEGAWSVQASFINDCGSSLAPQAINFTVNINPTLSVLNQSKEDFKIFPNPTNGIVTISGLNKTSFLNIQLLDMTGRVIFENKNYNTENRFDIDLSDYSSGSYFLKIETDSNQLIKKIIKR